MVIVGLFTHCVPALLVQALCCACMGLIALRASCPYGSQGLLKEVVLPPCPSGIPPKGGNGASTETFSFNC